jgi:hypothetical protein
MTKLNLENELGGAVGLVALSSQLDGKPGMAIATEEPLSEEEHNRIVKQLKAAGRFMDKRLGITKD